MTTTVRQLLDEKGHNVISVGADDTVFDAVRKMAEVRAPGDRDRPFRLIATSRYD